MAQFFDGSHDQDYESYLQMRNEALAEQLARAKAHLEILIQRLEQGWTKNDPSCRIALDHARKFIQGG